MTRLLIPALVALLFCGPAAAENSVKISNFGWSFDNDIFYVSNMLRVGDGATAIVNYNDLYKDIKILGSWVVDRFHEKIKRQKVLKISHSRPGKDRRNTDQIFSFCKETGKLIEYEITVPVSNEDISNGIFLEEGNDLFIGFPIQAKLIDLSFNGIKATSFTWENDLVRRQSSIFSALGPTRITHKFLDAKFSKEIGTYKNPCRSGKGVKIDLNSINFRGAREVIVTATSIAYFYERRRSVYDECSLLHIEERPLYDKFWSQYDDLNRTLYLDVLAKSKKILASIGSKIISAEFDEELKSKRKFIRWTQKSIRRDNGVPICDNLLNKEPMKITDVYELIDARYVLEYRIE